MNDLPKFCTYCGKAMRVGVGPRGYRYWECSSIRTWWLPGIRTDYLRHTSIDLPDAPSNNYDPQTGAKVAR